MLSMVRDAAERMRLSTLSAVPVDDSPSVMQFFLSSAYHRVILPMLILTLILAFLARPKASEVVPAGFRKFQLIYLSVWCICIAADWLQGPYVYALYQAYGFTNSEIAHLFVAGFGSSLVFGCFVGSMADKFGRKRSCLAYCILYIISCLTKHCKGFWVLMFGRITGGIATSMVFSCFECWLVSEHTIRHNFSPGLLSYMFGLMFSVMYFIAIVSGLVAQAAADAVKFAPISEGSWIYTGGYCSPFDLSALCLVAGFIMIAFLWEENYGNEDSDSTAGTIQNVKEATSLMFSRRSVFLLCVIVASFEGSMYAFVFNWTPALDSEDSPAPHGVIFSLFMMACMCGASAATLTGNRLTPVGRLTGTFAAGSLAFVIAAMTAGNPDKVFSCFVAFMCFEFCCGLYFPSVGILKSEIVPEHVRATMYNIYRVPLNAVVVGLLLTNISMVRCFVMNAILLALSCFAVMGVASTKPESAES